MAARMNLFDLPEWMDRAACKHADHHLFFVEAGGAWRDAQTICAACPVRAECLQYAIDTQQPAGIWGGLGVKARRKLYPESKRVSGNGTCLIEDCDGTRRGRGYCNLHYLRLRRHGTATWEPPVSRVSPERLAGLEGLTHREAARRLKVSEVTVWRARKRLANGESA
jgi:WhiB family redox-sensing transcriptional regulator